MTAIRHHRPQGGRYYAANRAAPEFEWAFIFDDDRDQAAFLERVEQLGPVSPSDLLGWLLATRLTGTMQKSGPTRAKYRKILDELAERWPPDGPDWKTPKRRRSEAGRARLVVVASAGLAGAAMALAPIIYEDDVMSTRAAA